MTKMSGFPHQPALGSAMLTRPSTSMARRIVSFLGTALSAAGFPVFGTCFSLGIQRYSN